MNAVNLGPADQATAAVTSVAGGKAVRELRIRWIGHTLAGVAAAGGHSAGDSAPDLGVAGVAPQDPGARGGGGVT